jgi:transposase
MYYRRKLNKSGSTSVYVLKKIRGEQNLVKVIGNAREESAIRLLELEAENFIRDQIPQQSFDFAPNQSKSYTNKSKIIEEAIDAIPDPVVKLIGPELVLGKIFDEIGLNVISNELFRDIVISRLIYPRSKLKTTQYLLYYRQQLVDVSKIYRFLDKLRDDFKDEVEKIIFEHTKKISSSVSVMFYDMTTLYFEADHEDDFRKKGFSKDGKAQCPQIMIGLLVGENGYPIGYDIYEGNTAEVKTLLPILEKIKLKYSLENLTVIADSGLLSGDNIGKLVDNKYTYIIGGRIENESNKIKNIILENSADLKDGETFEIEIEKGEEGKEKKKVRLIVGYSEKRAFKDNENREKGIKRLEKRFASGKITKAHINNRGYNKFLKIDIPSKIPVGLDHEQIAEDKKWDGLKGYVTNTEFKHEEILDNYKQLWHIEKAFRISKGDLKLRPIFHRKKSRIEAHICICFVAYAVFKELERKLLQNAKSKISPYAAIELLRSIYRIELFSPFLQKYIYKWSNLLPEQKNLLDLFDENKKSSST